MEESTAVIPADIRLFIMRLTVYAALTIQKYYHELLWRLLKFVIIGNSGYPGLL